MSRRTARRASAHTPSLAHDEPHGTGPLVVLLPGAGDVRSENRFLAGVLADAGYRVVTADLPGHGDSPTASAYGVDPTATALLDLVHGLGDEPAIVVGNSFAPAAAVVAARRDPAAVRAIVAISPHFEADRSAKGRLLTGLTRLCLRGPAAAPAWERLYRSWYKAHVPGDLDTELAKLRAMLADPARRRAVRETLTAGRDGVAEAMAELGVPALVVYGTADDHFSDPAAEAERVAALLHGESVLVEGAGHYPHVERPEVVGPAVASFLARLPA